MEVGGRAVSITAGSCQSGCGIDSCHVLSPEAEKDGAIKAAGDKDVILNQSEKSVPLRRHLWERDETLRIAREKLSATFREM